MEHFSHNFSINTFPPKAYFQSIRPLQQRNHSDDPHPSSGADPLQLM